MEQILVVFLQILVISFFAFGVTLGVNKSSLFACKRKFVEERYKVAVSQGSHSFFHWFWYKMFTCSMCLGFWSSILGTSFIKIEHHVLTIIGAFGLNWLLHCVENCLVSQYKAASDKNIEKYEN